MKKKIIYDTLFTEDPRDFFNGDLHTIIETLQQVQAKALARGITSIIINSEIESYDDDYVEATTTIGGNRLETDEECKVRKKQEADARARAAKYEAQKKKEELALYNKLKKKFENVKNESSSS